MTAELIAIIALGGLLTPILLAMNGRMNALADRLQTLGERVAKVESQICGGASGIGVTLNRPRRCAGERADHSDADAGELRRYSART